MHLLTPTAQYNDVVSIITHIYMYICVCVYSVFVFYVNVMDC